MQGYIIVGEDWYRQDIDVNEYTDKCQIHWDWETVETELYCHTSLSLSHYHHSLAGTVSLLCMLREGI